MLYNKSVEEHSKEQVLQRVRGRSGGLLIIVVVLMAVSIILITSALTITLAARNRYYGSALTSQATLTATSVAKTIAGAVVSGDITISQIESLAAGGESVLIPVTSSATANIASGSASNNSVAPGLAGDAGSSNTTATVSYYPDTTSKTYIKVTVTTQLDAGTATDLASDTVSILLKKVYPSGAAGAFANQVTLGVAGTSNDLPQINIGTSPAISGATNYAVIHGNISLANSGANTFTSDILVTDKLSLGANTTLQGNMVLVGDNASIVNGSGGSVYVKGYILVLGTTKTSPMFSPSALTTAGTWQTTKGIYVTNKTMTITANWNILPVMTSPGGTVAGPNSVVSYRYTDAAARVYKGVNDSSATVTRNGTTVAYSTDAVISAVCAAAKAEADKYIPVLTNNVSRMVPTSAEAFAAGYSGAYSTAAEVRAATQGSSPAVTLLTAAMMSGSVPMPASTAYCIDLTTGASTINGTSTSGIRIPTILTFDVTAHEVVLYVIGGPTNTLTIGELGLINFVRTGGVNFGKIILLGGCDINILTNNSGDSTNDSGIIGSTHNAAPSAAARTSYIAGNPVFLYIYGMGESANVISAGSGSTIEGYIGLFGTSGQLKLTGGGDPPDVYARYEGAILTNTGGNTLSFPYCPAPGSSFTSTTGEVVAQATYQVSGYMSA